MKEYAVEIIMAVTIFALSLLPTTCVMNANWRVAEMVANGADPLAARCAIWGGTACVIEGVRNHD